MKIGELSESEPFNTLIRKQSYLHKMQSINFGVENEI